MEVSIPICKGSIMLRFSQPNAKLKRLEVIKWFIEGYGQREYLYSFDLPAGRSCPGARECHSQPIKIGKRWRVQDGRFCRFRCYSASQEVVFPKLRKMRERNLKELKGKGKNQLINTILQSLPCEATIIRLHSSGDFFSQTYFDAWLEVARQRSDILFYAYTKAVPFWKNRLRKVNRLDNLRLVASLGGKYDQLARNLRNCLVVLSKQEAENLGRPIDHDDGYASGVLGMMNFAVLIHGPQPKGSEESKAACRLQKKGQSGYRRNIKGYGFHKKNLQKVG